LHIKRVIDRFLVDGEPPVNEINVLAQIINTDRPAQDRKKSVALKIVQFFHTEIFVAHGISEGILVMRHSLKEGEIYAAGLYILFQFLDEFETERAVYAHAFGSLWLRAKIFRHVRERRMPDVVIERVSGQGIGLRCVYESAFDPAVGKLAGRVIGTQRMSLAAVGRGREREIWNSSVSTIGKTGRISIMP
jgi:hypothetical protein